MNVLESEKRVRELYERARELGGEDAYDDCIGGSIRAPDGASKECEEAVRAYRRAEIEHYGKVYGPALHDYYNSRP